MASGAGAGEARHVGQSRGVLASNQALEQGVSAGESAMPTMGVNRGSELEVDDVLNSKLQKPAPSDVLSSIRLNLLMVPTLPRSLHQLGKQSLKHEGLWVGISHSNHGGMALRLAFSPCRILLMGLPRLSMLLNSYMSELPLLSCAWRSLPTSRNAAKLAMLHFSDDFGFALG